jgi:hypothetical protein
MNVEDTKLGAAVYIIQKQGIAAIELKWGQDTDSSR